MMFLKKREQRVRTGAVSVFRIWKGRREITEVYCTIRIIFYYILIFFFLTPSIISFIIVANVWVGGNESGSDFVKQRDEYMYRCDILPPPPWAPFYLLPHCHTWCPIFVTEACTHSSLLRSCPDVFSFTCKTKTCNIITKLLSFSLPKSELLKTLKSNKKKKIWNIDCCLKSSVSCTHLFLVKWHVIGCIF